MKTTEITGLSFWASYLINGDDSGLEPADIAECDAWCARHNVDPRHCLTADEDGIGWVEVGGREVMVDCMAYTFQTF